MSDIKDAIFPIIRRDFSPKPQPDLLDSYEQGHPDPGTKCMRLGCQEPRWVHPVKGQLVLCHDHGLAVAQGQAHAPPLRQNIDYQGYGPRSLVFIPYDPTEEPDKG